MIPINNLAAEVRLIRRGDFDNERTAGRNLEGDWEFARQQGTPYGMARRFLPRARRDWPCTPPPWGTLECGRMRTPAR